MNQSETIGELAGALAKAQGMMGHALKSAENPFFKSKYADLAAVIEAIRKPLSDSGLSYTQMVDTADDGMVLITTLMHSSGEFQSSCYPINPVKQDPQGFGSAISYARRYGLSSAIGLAQDDDDGNSASQAGASKAVMSKTKKDEFCIQVRQALEKRDNSRLNKLWGEHNQEEQVVLWGLLSDEERNSIKKLKNEGA